MAHRRTVADQRLSTRGANAGFPGARAQPRPAPPPAQRDRAEPGHDARIAASRAARDYPSARHRRRRRSLLPMQRLLPHQPDSVPQAQNRVHRKCGPQAQHRQQPDGLAEIRLSNSDPAGGHIHGAVPLRPHDVVRVTVAGALRHTPRRPGCGIQPADDGCRRRSDGFRNRHRRSHRRVNAGQAIHKPRCSQRTRPRRSGDVHEHAHSIGRRRADGRDPSRIHDLDAYHDPVRNGRRHSRKGRRRLLGAYRRDDGLRQTCSTADLPTFPPSARRCSS